MSVWSLSLAASLLVWELAILGPPDLGVGRSGPIDLVHLAVHASALALLVLAARRLKGAASFSLVLFALLSLSVVARVPLHAWIDQLASARDPAPWLCALSAPARNEGVGIVALVREGFVRALADLVVIVPFAMMRALRGLDLRFLRRLAAPWMLLFLLTCTDSGEKMDSGFADAPGVEDASDGGEEDVDLPDDGGTDPFQNPCDDGGPIREYAISAIAIDMTLNRFGDHTPGYMYALDERIPEIEAAQAIPLPDRVSAGLRKDLIQPLVLRANLGECLVIRFTNRLEDGAASLHLHGLAHRADAGLDAIGRNPGMFAANGETVVYRVPLPTDPLAERAYYFHDAGAHRDRISLGLFGAIIAEPAGATYLDVETGAPMASTDNDWEAIVSVPDGSSFREFVLIYHEIGHEDYEGLVDANGVILPKRDSLTRTYRPGSRAINYRSEPFRNRLLLKNDEALGYSSYTFGDPATPIARSYLGEPTKTRLLHGGSEVSHVHHLHGGATRWRRNPGADPTNDIASGLTKVPVRNARSIHLDSQTIGPGTAYSLLHECGAGGCQQVAGDFLYHCHIGHHYLSGMWGLWRVFDTLQPDLAAIPGREAPPVAITSDQLAGLSVEGKALTPRAIYQGLSPSEQATRLSLEDFIEDQLPPPGARLDDRDATVWDWNVEVLASDLPLYRGEPDATEAIPNYRSPTPGERPPILFNPTNGRYAWPLKRPHPRQRPPFTGRGHTGAPWLGQSGTRDRPDGLCPNNEVVPNPLQQIRRYPITAVTLPIQVSADRLDPAGKLYVLGEDKDAVLGGQRPAVPLAIRSNTGDCVEITLTNELTTGEKVNLHTHFVQFDPQGSDGVIAGFSYEQSIEPYRDEQRSLIRDAVPGASTIVVRSPNSRRLREGIWLGVGLGSGMCGSVPCTEIRRIAGLTTDVASGTSTITLDAPLLLAHTAGEAAGVEFVRHDWYSDIDSGTVFYHTHVNFEDWDHGLFGAHIIEPEGSSHRDPATGEELRSGLVADIVDPLVPAASDIQGSFREVVLIHNNRQGGARPSATINLRGEPFASRLLSRNDPSLVFSSVVHGDPITTLPRAYVGDPFLIRNLGVVENSGGLRVTGHRFKLERWAEDGTPTDVSPAGISERFDVSLEGGAGGPLGLAGDYLYYSTNARDFALGAWGLIRVHDTLQPDLLPLPDRAVPPVGAGFPDQIYDPNDPNRAPLLADDAGSPCPPGAPVRAYEIELGRANVVQNEAQGSLPFPGYAYRLLSGPNGAAPPPELGTDGNPLVREPLVLRANQGECLEIALENALERRAALHVNKLLFDPQGSYGAAVGFNRDSTVAPGDRRTYRFFADREVGSGYLIDLADPTSGIQGAFAGVVVEPAGSSFVDPATGSAIDTGVIATIQTPSGGFREMVALFHDDDAIIGETTMPYPIEVVGFSGLSYSSIPLSMRGSLTAPEAVFSSATWGDPRFVLSAYQGDRIIVRVAAPAAEQPHVFSLDGHRFTQDPTMAGSEHLYSRTVVPGDAFDAVMIEGAGMKEGGYGDYLIVDHRLPFMDHGLFSLFRVFELEDDEGPVPIADR